MPSQLNNLTNHADQVMVLQLPAGGIATLELMYHGATKRWIMNLEYGDVVIDGIGVCCHPNLLRQWKNVIPFGLACATQFQTDPTEFSDFVNGNAVLYLLDEADVQFVESSILGGVQS